MTHFIFNLIHLLELPGYFQNMPLCVDDTRRLWTTGLVANFTMRPGDNDISIYLRCVPRHYHFNGVHFYENILNHTSFDRVWLFQAPECPTKLGADPSKDGVIAAVVRLLVEKYNATRWPGFQGTDDVSFLLHDLSGLIQSKKVLFVNFQFCFMLTNCAYSVFPAHFTCIFVGLLGRLFLQSH
jgi:hypothetical protein